MDFARKSGDKNRSAGIYEMGVYGLRGHTGGPSLPVILTILPQSYLQRKAEPKKSLCMQNKIFSKNCVHDAVLRMLFILKLS